MIKKMLLQGLTIDQIHKYTGAELPLIEQVQSESVFNNDSSILPGSSDNSDDFGV